MSRGGLRGRWIGAAALLGCGLIAVYVQLVPFTHSADGHALPDLLFCLVAAWTLRSPASASLPLVVALGLFGDLMLSRPIGLGALALVLASEVLRAKRDSIQVAPFPLEWLVVTGLFALMLAGSALALRFVFANGPGLDAARDAAVSTALGYPLVVFLLRYGIGLRGPFRARGFGRQR